MTILSRYLAAAGPPSPMESQEVFDEFAAADGTVFHNSSGSRSAMHCRVAFIGRSIPIAC